MGIINILLFGALVVAIYMIAHVITMQAERWYGQPMGIWRSVLFFGIFFILLLVAMQLLPQPAAGPPGGPS